MKDFIKPDLARGGRCGIPEVVYGAGKSPGELIDISKDFLKEEGRVIITRLDESRFEKLKKVFGSVDDVVLEQNERAGTLVLRNKDFDSASYGTVGLITAGTSDIAVAEEARVILNDLGAKTRVEYDVGIAGIHRVFDALDSLSGVDLFIVVAGMEGALPSVVAGLVDKPVIAVPSSVGYGTGEKGFAALNTMLNSCTPLAVVNVDNGFGAASIALKIMRLCASHKND